MKKVSPRVRRIGDQIQRELAEILRDHTKDPRIGFVTLTGVEVTADLAHAKVFFTNMGAISAAADAEQALARAAGFLRSEIAHRLGSFTVPQLHFVYDVSIERGMEMSYLIDQAIAQESHPPATLADTDTDKT
ncbi:MAG: 30S ribosome-binding factor RbfA [Burkholderiales bacterium]|jgi:ribosome-binding factor A|nr:30S ribosome-binding factor RbfA [Burkholderiales bacterium]